MDIQEEINKLINLVQLQEAERAGPDRGYYAAACRDTQKQKELIIKYVLRIEDALDDSDPKHNSW